MYDVIVLGGGPGGVAAGIYAARKQMKTLFLTVDFLSQSAVSAGIENWIGTETITGYAFAQSLEKHLRAQTGIEIRTGERVTTLSELAAGYLVKTEKGEYQTRTVIIATGGRHRHLDIPGEEKFIGKGVVFCSTCDAPFFRGKRVAVVGGGNAGLEAVEDLLPYASEIILISRGGALKGDQITQEKILADKRVRVLYHAIPEEILGEQQVTGLKILHTSDEQETSLLVDGVFVEIGMVPNTDMAKGLVDLNERGEIIIDHRTMETSKRGIFAVGDVTDAPYKQNNISAGQGVVAALSAYDAVRKQGDGIDKA